MCHFFCEMPSYHILVNCYQSLNFILCNWYTYILNTFQFSSMSYDLSKASVVSAAFSHRFHHPLESCTHVVGLCMTFLWLCWINKLHPLIRCIHNGNNEPTFKFFRWIRRKIRLNDKIQNSFVLHQKFTANWQVTHFDHFEIKKIDSSRFAYFPMQTETLLCLQSIINEYEKQWKNGNFGQKICELSFLPHLHAR